MGGVGWFWAFLGYLGAILRGPGVVLAGVGGSWDELGAVLGAFWVVLEASWGATWSCLGVSWDNTIELSWLLNHIVTSIVVLFSFLQSKETRKTPNITHENRFHLY